MIIKIKIILMHRCVTHVASYMLIFPMQGLNARHFRIVVNRPNWDWPGWSGKSLNALHSASLPLQLTSMVGVVRQQICGGAW